MVDWYDANLDNTDLFEDDQNVICFLIVNGTKYEKMSDKQKRRKNLPPTTKNQGNKTHFFKVCINQDNIRKIVFTQNAAYFPNGLYYVKQDDDNIFFVFPTEKTTPNGQSIIACDHLSFPMLKNKTMNVHLTSYVPNALNIEIGDISHQPNEKIVNGVELPEAGFNTPIFDAFGPIKNNMIELVQKYNVDQRGCAGRSGSKRLQQRVRGRIGIKLENLLSKYKITRVEALGFYSEADGQYHMTVNLARLSKSKLSHDFAFRMGRPSFADFQTRLVAALDGL
jgi:hypothetical protein